MNSNLDRIWIDDFDNDEMPESEHCEMCGGPAMSMGILGDAEWFRCRNCGWENSIDRQDN
jgi:tRNA(Ile2) C34 agmatinyltransferase TiaS